MCQKLQQCILVRLQQLRPLISLMQRQITLGPGLMINESLMGHLGINNTSAAVQKEAGIAKGAGETRTAAAHLREGTLEVSFATSPTVCQGTTCLHNILGLDGASVRELISEVIYIIDFWSMLHLCSTIW